MRRTIPTRAALAAAVAATLALAACQRQDEAPAVAQADTTPMTPRGPGEMSGNVGTSGTGSAKAPLPMEDIGFVTQAAEGGQFEVEIAKLAAEKATSAEVKAFAQMLVEDHRAANDRLRQIATSHDLALPASLPDAKKTELEQLAKLSGPEFDRQYVKLVGVQDHHKDIAEFEKASQAARSPDVREFAQSTLPALKKHLAAAQKLPGAKG